MIHGLFRLIWHSLVRLLCGPNNDITHSSPTRKDKILKTQKYSVPMVRTFAKYARVIKGPVLNTVMTSRFNGNHFRINFGKILICTVLQCKFTCILRSYLFYFFRWSENIVSKWLEGYCTTSQQINGAPIVWVMKLIHATPINTRTSSELIMSNHVKWQAILLSL